MSDTAPNAVEVTLESTLQALNHWRNNKNNKSTYPELGIPTKIWEMIFKLEEQNYKATDIRRIFGLSGEQYKRKKQALSDNLEKPTPNPNKPTDDEHSITLCEAAIQSNHVPPEVPSLNQADDNKRAVKQLRSTTDHPMDYLDFTTVIIECIRPDGHRLNIHASNQSIDIIMKAFYHELGETK